MTEPVKPETPERAEPGETSAPRLFDEAFLRRLDRLRLVTRRAQPGQLQGERRSPKRGHSVEFVDYRPYVPGDDFRQIDWHVYARLERFFVKLFAEEEDITVHLLVDASRSMAWGTPPKMEMARKLAGALGYIALNGLDRVTALTFGEQAFTLPPRRGRWSALALFSLLERATPDGAVDFAATMQRYAQTARRPGPLLLISDLLAPDWAEGLRALVARRFEVTVLHVLAPEELDPSLRGDLRLRDSERDEIVEVTLDEQTVARYRQAVEGWREEIQRWCAARDVRYVFVPSHVTVEEAIFSLLVRQGIVR